MKRETQMMAQVFTASVCQKGASVVNMQAAALLCNTIKIEPKTAHCGSPSKPPLPGRHFPIMVVPYPCWHIRVLP